MITCPKCHHHFTLVGNGRHPYLIGMTEVCHAVKDSPRRDGKVCWAYCAAFIEKQYGFIVSPSFVRMRIIREAQKQGITREELIKQLCQ